MSRSWKKVPGYNDSEGKKIKAYYLRMMNRRIRCLDVLDENGWVPDGNYYRKFINRWDFRDYDFRYFSERALEESWFGKEEFYRLRRK